MEDYDLQYASAIRAMIDQETNTVSNRMNWLILLQAILFAAVSGLRTDKPVIVLIALVGCGIAMSLSREFKFSERAIAEILSRWNAFKANRAKRGGNLPDLPPAFAGGNCEVSRWDTWFASRRLLPALFIFAWIGVAIYYLIA